MQKGTLHFAHANGFPAGTYRKLLGFLRQEYVVIAIEKLGHNPKYPIDDNWEGLTKELVDYIDSNAEEPVVGVGHSFGGILTFMAAYHRPELFREIIMLDPPLAYGRLAAFLLFLAKKLRLKDRVGLVAQTKKRRTLWSSRQEAEAYFRQRAPFNTFDPDCLRDYVLSGTTVGERGVKLSFDVNVESKIFRTKPHNISSLGKRLNVPGTVIIGENSHVSRHSLNRFAKRHGLCFERFKDGSHLFPLEYPEGTAFLIMETIRKPKLLDSGSRTLAPIHKRRDRC